MVKSQAIRLLSTVRLMFVSEIPKIFQVAMEKYLAVPISEISILLAMYVPNKTRYIVSRK